MEAKIPIYLLKWMKTYVELNEGSGKVKPEEYKEISEIILNHERNGGVITQALNS